MKARGECWTGSLTWEPRLLATPSLRPMRREAQMVLISVHIVTDSPLGERGSSWP